MNAVDKVLELFEQISSVPRGTKREQKISQWLQAWAKAHGFFSRTDSTGNLVINVPASSGMENAPTIILQGHMDMVCEKTPDSDHDFTRDRSESSVTAIGSTPTKRLSAQTTELQSRWRLHWRRIRALPIRPSNCFLL